MEELILNSQAITNLKTIDKSWLMNMETIHHENLEEINRKTFTLLCFMKPLLFPTRISAINELQKLVLELGNLERIKLIFVFSERTFNLYQLLVKCNLENKITYICDSKLKYFDKFQVPNLYNNCCTSNQRNTHIFFLKSNSLIKTIEYGRIIPMDEIRSFLPLPKKSKKINQRNEIVFIEKTTALLATKKNKKHHIRRKSLYETLTSFKSKPKEIATTEKISSFGPKSPSVSQENSPTIETIDFFSPRSQDSHGDDISVGSENSAKSSSLFGSFKNLFHGCSFDDEDDPVELRADDTAPDFKVRKRRKSLDNAMSKKDSDLSLSFAGLTFKAKFKRKGSMSHGLDDKSPRSPRLISPRLAGTPVGRKGSAHAPNINLNFSPSSDSPKKSPATKKDLRTTKTVSLSMLDILQDEQKRKVFKKFSKSEYSSENIEFWERVQEFKKIKDKNERLDEAEMIYYHFLTPESDDEINVSSKLLKRVKIELFEALETNECPIEIFDAIVFELEFGALSDTLTRFKFTSDYFTINKVKK
eukprot:gene3311-5752_t